jgi:hypothetical protein
MTANLAPSVPASSLLDLKKRKVDPFDRPFWIVGVDGTTFNPPMLVEGVDASRDPDLEGWVDLSVWTKNHRVHQMTGLIVDPDATIFVTFDAPA